MSTWLALARSAPGSMVEAIPKGLCHCGCGEATNLAATSCPTRGRVKGEPYRYLLGHNNTKSRVQYLEDPDTGCWLWQRSTDPSGYASVWDRGVMRGAHRVFYERHVGPIPAGAQLDHLCRVRNCVNPAHLEPVLQAENSRRGANAKITAEIAAAIRASDETTIALGKRYGISATQAGRIKTGKQWAS